MDAPVPFPPSDDALEQLARDFGELWGVLQSAALLGARNDRQSQRAKALAAYLAARNRLAIAALDDLACGRTPVLFGVREEGLRALAPYATVELPFEAVLRWLQALHEALLERLRHEELRGLDGAPGVAARLGSASLLEALGLRRGGQTVYAVTAAELRSQPSASP